MHGVMPAYEFRRGFCTLVLSLEIQALKAGRIVLETGLSREEDDETHISMVAHEKQGEKLRIKERKVH